MVGLMAALESRDYLFATYREHGYALARGLDPGQVMADLFGKATGVSGGWGGPSAAALPVRRAAFGRVHPGLPRDRPEGVAGAHGPGRSRWGDKGAEGEGQPRRMRWGLLYAGAGQVPTGIVARGVTPGLGR